jgi:hypothetical protein
VTETTNTAPDAASRRRVGWPTLALAAVFGLLFAYDVWEAISTAVLLPQSYEAYGLDSSYVPWWLVIAGIAAPPVLYVLAFLIGRRRGPVAVALVFVVALALSAVVSLDLVAVQGTLLTDQLMAGLQ